MLQKYCISTKIWYRLDDWILVYEFFYINYRYLIWIGCYKKYYKIYVFTNNDLIFLKLSQFLQIDDILSVGQ